MGQVFDGITTSPDSVFSKLAYRQINISALLEILQPLDAIRL
jgi:hypothetical protein